MTNRLAEFRAKHKLTQEALATKADVSRPYISEIETGTQKVISNVVMSKIADALGESVVDIFFGSDVVCTQQTATACNKIQQINTD